MADDFMSTPEDRSQKTAHAAELARNFVVITPIIGSKEERLRALAFRRENPPEKIEDMHLWAHSPMHEYCISCGHGAALFSENDPARFAENFICPECQALKALGWLE